ncbi:MAG: transcription antitermination factor NusB [Cyanobacteria bacterium J06606_4]
MKARSIARELALLGISQLTDSLATPAPRPASRPSISRQGLPDVSPQEPASPKQLEALLVKALGTLSADAQEAFETATGELQRGERLVLESETRTVEVGDVRSRILPAIPLVESAINKVGATLNLLIFVQQENSKGMVTGKAALEAAAETIELADRLMAENLQKTADIGEVRSHIQASIQSVKQAIADFQQALSDTHLSNLLDKDTVRSYACDLLASWIQHWRSIDQQLDSAMEKWNIRRLARVDRDILRLAMVEIVYLNVPKKVAIDEAIEMAKRYSDEEGYRFINGVLRRATDKLEASQIEEPSTSV